jgi:signal transduction histidine kinase
MNPQPNDRSLFHRYFDPSLPMQVQTFNLLGTVGMAAGLLVALSGVVTGAGVMNIAINLAASVVAFVLLCLSRRHGLYHIFSWIVVVGVFILGFPVLFFTAGGYRSGTPCFYVFALIFTTLLLTKWERAAALAIEFAVYLSSCAVAYNYPQTVTPFAAEWDYALDVMVGIGISGLLLFLAVMLYVRANNAHHAIMDEMNRELKARNETLKEYDEMKSTFLTTVIHELRQPLTGIMTGAGNVRNMLDDEPQDKELISELLSRIGRNVRRADNTLLDLSDTVAIETGRLALSRSMTGLAPFLREICELHYDSMNRFHNTLVLDLENNLPALWFDKDRIEQVMVNLLSNAMQYTKGGEIRVALKSEPGRQIVSVADDGEGMDEIVREKALKAYVSVSRDYWRHGIGLFVCRQIVTSHGGEIWIDSERGRGTTVFFSLPAGTGE